MLRTRCKVVYNWLIWLQGLWIGSLLQLAKIGSHLTHFLRSLPHGGIAQNEEKKNTLESTAPSLTVAVAPAATTDLIAEIKPASRIADSRKVAC